MSDNEHMTFQEAYGIYLDIYGPGLRETFGVEPELVSTGGGCMAIELALESGLIVWITDAGDVLSPYPWRIDPNETEPFGFGASVHRDDEPDDIGTGALDYSATTVEQLVAVVNAALDDARRNGDGIDLTPPDVQPPSWYR